MVKTSGWNLLRGTEDGVLYGRLVNLCFSVSVSSRRNMRILGLSIGDNEVWQSCSSSADVDHASVPWKYRTFGYNKRYDQCIKS